MLSIIQSDPLSLGYSVFQMALKIRNLSLCRQLFEHLRVDLSPQAVCGWALLPDTSIYNDLFPVQGRSATLLQGGATAKTAGD